MEIVSILYKHTLLKAAELDKNKSKFCTNPLLLTNTQPLLLWTGMSSAATSDLRWSLGIRICTCVKSIFFMWAQEIISHSLE